MKEEIKEEYVKRTQNNYPMAFKLSVVQEVEQGVVSVSGAARKYGIQGSHTVVTWLRKYGTFDWENQTPTNMPKSQEQRIMELEQEVRLLKNRKPIWKPWLRTRTRKRSSLT
jgi:transposase